jgi:glyoxylase I family protein
MTPLPADDAKPIISGLHHLSLTVSDLDASVPWYQATLGFVVLGEDDHAGGRTVVLIQHPTELTLLLQQHKAHEGSNFSEHRPGLDHLAFRVSSKDELERWRAYFESLAVEFQSIIEEEYGSVLIFRDPDRIQLELFVDPGARDPGPGAL